MNSPVICIRDLSIPNGSLMIKDMWPNRSLANPVVDPAPQGPRYLRQPENTLPVVVADVVTREVSGLAAYLLVTVDAGDAGANFTPAQAKTAADDIITEMRTGGDLDVATVEGILAGVVEGSGIVGTGDSTATLGNILAIVGGAKFVVPAGTDVGAVFQTEAAQEALFDTGAYAPIVDEDSSFWISLAQGNLFKAKNNRVNPVTGAALDPLVVVYDVDGTVL